MVSFGVKYILFLGEYEGGCIESLKYFKEFLMNGFMEGVGLGNRILKFEILSGEGENSS